MFGVDIVLLWHACITCVYRRLLHRKVVAGDRLCMDYWIVALLYAAVLTVSSRF